MTAKTLGFTVRRATQRGYNLVELLVAIGFLAVVLLTVLTLFFLGSGNVYSGKQQTVAVSIGTDIMEDIAELGVADIYGAFVIPNGNAPTAVATIPADTAGTASTMPQSSYPNSIVRSTYVRSASTELGYPNGLLSQWHALLFDPSGRPKLADPSISIVLTPRERFPTGAANLTVGPTGNATVLHVRVLVRWREKNRYRQVVLDSTKVKRPTV